MQAATSKWVTLVRGLRCRCPRCGVGSLFRRFTSVNSCCSHCGLDFSKQRADDAPPYLVIVIVGHIVVPLALVVEKNFHLTSFQHLLIWLPLSLGLCLALLPPMKGFVIAIQWLNGMHGFNQNESQSPIE